MSLKFKSLEEFEAWAKTNNVKYTLDGKEALDSAKDIEKESLQKESTLEYTILYVALALVIIVIYCMS